MSDLRIARHPIDDQRQLLEIELDAPRSLNALTLSMIEQMQPALDAAREDPSVMAVVLRGAGDKAFCAGGDVRTLAKTLLEDRDAGLMLAEQFFSQEYLLDYCLHTYPKPIICWGSGIVMGGGKGLLAGCSHRVVTETSVLAMPEVTIALYPDVGGSWFLERLPGRTGLFLAVTGARLNAADVLFLGLGNRFVESARYGEMLERLQSADWNGGDAHAVTSAVLRQLETDSAGAYEPRSKLREHFDTIQRLTDADDERHFFARLQALETDDPWLQKAVATATHGSPLAIRVMAEQLRRNRHTSLREAFESELVLSINCCRQNEFAEGVRALLIDKDGAPQWRYREIDAVPDADVAAFFESPWADNPLVAMLDRADAQLASR